MHRACLNILCWRNLLLRRTLLTPNLTTGLGNGGGVNHNLTLITWNLACCSEATFELVLDQVTIHHPCWDILFLQETFVTQQSAVHMSVHTVELGKLSTEAGKRSKCPALVVRDSFPFEIVRHRASEKWVICYCRPCKRSVWIFVCAHFPSSEDAPRVLPCISGLSAALKTLEISSVSCGERSSVGRMLTFNST